MVQLAALVAGLFLSALPAEDGTSVVGTGLLGGEPNEVAIISPIVSEYVADVSQSASGTNDGGAQAPRRSLRSAAVDVPLASLHGLRLHIVNCVFII